VSERRRVESRPYSAPVGHHNQQPSARGQDAPNLAQQGDGIACHFESVNEEHPINRGVGQRHFQFVNERSKTRPVGRPFHHPLHRRHESQAAFCLLAK
jgi:hypothetical protein